MHLLSHFRLERTYGSVFEYLSLTIMHDCNRHYWKWLMPWWEKLLRCATKSIFLYSLTDKWPCWQQRIFNNAPHKNSSHRIWVKKVTPNTLVALIYLQNEGKEWNWRLVCARHRWDARCHYWVGCQTRAWLCWWVNGLDVWPEAIRQRWQRWKWSRVNNEDY